MTRILACSLLLVLSACAKALPSADPDKAWVDLHTIAGNQLSANQLDGLDWSDARYFEVKPGQHRLQVRLQFDISGGGSGREHSGGGGGTRTCILALDYAHFVAGQTYRLKAGQVARRGWLRLYDAQGNLLSRGKQLRCGAF